jgi:putative transposase
MQKAQYDTDLTSAQWQLLEPLLPQPKRLGRPRTPLREIVNALLYAIKTGCQWRLLPKTFPPWPTVYHILRRWSREAVLGSINDRLRALVRERADNDYRPAAAILDSQTERSAGHSGTVGYDAGKKTKGRKRFLLVGTLGMVLAVGVCPANTP